MIQTVLEALYFILPAYLANMAPVLLKSIPWGAAPISARLFGKNKTWRGLISGYAAALLVLAIQTQITTPYALLNYSEINIFLYALPLGFGALLGDLIESFVKRRLKIKPGAPFIPFDQLDFVLGALLVLSPLYILPTLHIITLLLITPILHLLSNITAYKLKLKKVWW